MKGFNTIVLLVLANVFMTFAWYAHLKNLSAQPWWIAVLASWAIALLEYIFQVPANRIGFEYADWFDNQASKGRLCRIESGTAAFTAFIGG